MRFLVSKISPFSFFGVKNIDLQLKSAYNYYSNLLIIIIMLWSDPI